MKQDMTGPAGANPDDDQSEDARARRLAAAFQQAFGARPDFIARAPGRVNLIGEHTDYQGGFVLPVAIDRTVLIAARGVPGSRDVELCSLNYDERAAFSLDGIEPGGEGKPDWSSYVRGVAWALESEKLVDLANLPGVQMAIEGNVPTGAGLSSSAALEMAAALCFVRLAGVTVERTALARACQRAENEFVGVMTGIMDQFISALAQAGSALLIDTRALGYSVVPLGLEEAGYKLVAVDSAVPRSLITSAYNQRYDEVAEATNILGAELGLGRGAQLRDVTLEQLEEHKGALPELLYRRARHVIGENRRTLEAADLMRQGRGADNLQKLGELLYASHASLRDDYEVSSKELDLLVELASQVDGTAGARMTGAGFGGSTVNIVHADSLDAFRERVVEEYRRRTQLPARMYVIRAVEGSSYLEV